MKRNINAVTEIDNAVEDLTNQINNILDRTLVTVAINHRELLGTPEIRVGTATRT